MEKVLWPGYRGVRRGRTLKDGTPRFIAEHAGFYLGSFSTTFAAARAHDAHVAKCVELFWPSPRDFFNFPPLKYARRPCLPGTRLRDFVVAEARHAMLNAPTKSRFEREALLRRAGL
jgi:hypothetical protein